MQALQHVQAVLALTLELQDALVAWILMIYSKEISLIQM